MIGNGFQMLPNQETKCDEMRMQKKRETVLNFEKGVVSCQM